MRAGAFAAAAFSLGLLLSAGSAGYTQTPPAAAPPPPPLPGFMQPYEIARIVRSAGFDPLTRPLREGTTYVVRATDYRGILMRVVVDAQSGAIRAVNRIVVESEPYGAVGMLPELYGPPTAYGPPEFDLPHIVPREEGAMPPAPTPAAIHPAVHPFGPDFPPLPRPRPPELAARKAVDDAKPGIKSGPKPAEADAQPAAKSAASPSTSVAGPSALPSAPTKPPPLMNE